MEVKVWYLPLRPRKPKAIGQISSQSAPKLLTLLCRDHAQFIVVSLVQRILLGHFLVVYPFTLVSLTTTSASSASTASTASASELYLISN